LGKKRTEGRKKIWKLGGLSPHKLNYLSKSYKHRYFYTLYLYTRYITGMVQCKMKVWGSLLKIINNFRTAKAEP